jgi:hypothetical protein
VPAIFACVLVGAVVERGDLPFLQGDADRHRDDRLGHRVRDEALGRAAVVLVAFDLDDAILDDHEAHDALARQVVVDAELPAVVEVPADARLVPGLRQRHRRAAGGHHIGLAAEDAFDLALVAEGADPHRFVVEPVPGVADRVALGLAEFVLVRCSHGVRGGERQQQRERDSIDCHGGSMSGSNR